MKDSDPDLHLVERPDARHALPHLALGKQVGEDEFGNVYYEGGTDSEGRTRRWVIYNGYAEASAIPPGLARLDASSRRHAALGRELHSRATGRSRTSQT